MYMYLIYMYMHIYNIQIHVSVCKCVIRTWVPHAVNTASRCKHLVIFVLLRFCFMREGTQGFRVPPIVNPLNNGFLKSYDANHLIKHLKKKSPGRAPIFFFKFRCKSLHKFFTKKSLRKQLKDLSLICILYRYCKAVLLEYSYVYTYMQDVCVSSSTSKVSTHDIVKQYCLNIHTSFIMPHKADTSRVLWPTNLSLVVY